MTSLTVKNFSIDEKLSQFFWCVFLVILVLISFIGGPYKSDYWLMMSVFIYAYSVAYLVFCLCGGNHAFKVMKSVKGAILLLLLALFWLALPMLNLWESSFDNHTLGHASYPKWFVVDLPSSVTPERTKWLLLSNVMIFTLFLISLSLLNQRRRVKELIWVLFTVGFIHAFLGVFAKYSGIYFIDKVMLDGHFDAARGWFVNRNHFAAFVSLCLVAAIAMQFKLLMTNTINHARDLFSKQLMTVSLLVLAFGVGALFLSESRGAFLALIVSAVMCICFLMRKEKLNIKKHYVIVFFIFFVIALSLFFWRRNA